MCILGLATILLYAHVVLGENNTPPHRIDCKDEKDGLHEIGCWGYANCLGGVPDVHSCDSGEVFDRHSMTCVQPGMGKTDCYLPQECVGKADGSYPDLGDNCITYYRCQGGLTLGRLYCPDKTHFNQALQICDYPYNLFAPCGTKVDPNAPASTPVPTTAVPTTATAAPSMSTTTVDQMNMTAQMNMTDPPAAVATFQKPVVVG